MFVPTKFQKDFFERIDAMRLHVFGLTSPQATSDFSDKIVDFDRTLSAELKERFADETIKKSVPEWHKLVGSTPESSAIQSEAREFIEQRVIAFVIQLEKDMSM
jgi:hypothetical protein